MLLMHGIVIVLADGEKLELYRNAGNEADPRLTAMPAPVLDEHNRGAGMHHHSATGNPSAKLNEDAHAAAVAEWLNSEVAEQRISDVFIAAAPKTLGEMRKHLKKRTEQAVRGELAKDLLGTPPQDIVKALRTT